LGVVCLLDHQVDVAAELLTHLAVLFAPIPFAVAGKAEQLASHRVGADLGQLEHRGRPS